MLAAYDILGVPKGTKSKKLSLIHILMLVKALIGNVRARFTDMSSISIWALEYSSAVSPLLNTSLRLLLKKIPHKNAIQPIAVNIKRKIPLRRYMDCLLYTSRCV